MIKTGKEKLIEQFMADGCYYMFGNPGTVEQGFLDVIGNYSDFQYISCLQESIAVAMADGYARKTGSPAIVQLHCSVGLGNGIGMIYQALRGHSPLVILAGEAGIQYDAMEAQMACDLVAMARPVTKWSGRVLHRGSVLRMVRRAIKLAMTPPMGPVFLALPLDILDELNQEPVVATTRICTNTAPAGNQEVEEAAELLAGAVSPLFLIGDGAGFSGAQTELFQIAEQIGAKVYGVDNSQMNFDCSSYLYQGDLGHMFGSTSREKVKNADVVFLVGTYIFPEVFPMLESPFREDVKIIHVDLDTGNIAKNFGVTLGIAADPAATLKRIEEHLLKIQTKRQKQASLERMEKLKIQWETQKKEWKASGIFDDFCRLLKEKVGEEVIVFDEALTSSDILTHYFPASQPGTFFQTRGGSLGVGIPGAIGLKLAASEKKVFGFTGDGGSLYTIQALQTATRYHIGAKFVIINNGDYQLLKDNMDAYWKQEGIAPHAYPDCFDLTPQTDFVKLSEAFGVKARKLSDSKEVQDAVLWMLEDEEPALLIIEVNNLQK